MDNSLPPGSRAPSTNELAEFHSINPATARKGLTILADRGVLEKRRGLGMFVTDDARNIILAARQDVFGARFVVPMVDEAAKLGMNLTELLQLTTHIAESRGLYS